MKRLWAAVVALVLYREINDEADRVSGEYAALEREILTDWYEDGSHDRYPQMTDTVREVCIGYLERMFALPDAEVRR